MDGLLTSFLLGQGDPPSPAAIREARLGAYAYTVLPREHADRSAYSGDFLSSLARCQDTKAKLAPLLAAWRAAGIEALLFKGFHLAEFIYPVAAARFWGDVDVVLRPGDIPAAASVAEAMGWSAWPEAGGSYSLIHPDGVVRVDVQRYVVHGILPWNRRQRRITEAVWARSTECSWLGVTVRLPHPVDAALVCLLVHRAWGADGWGCKPHDLLDLRFLVERAGVSRDAMEARATELGCRRTLAIMLGRCDPWAGSLRLGLPRAARAWRYDVRTLTEHVPYRVALWLVRVYRAPDLFLQLARVTPLVLRVRRTARRVRDLPRLLASMTPASGATPRITMRERKGLVRGTRWALRLLPAGDVGGCVVRSLVLYRALRRRGLPVDFVSGVRRDGDRVVGHAWIELNGMVVPELDEPTNPHIFRVNFRYPRMLSHAER
ncbi:MAG TPA: lasso peptide biosynthesis B2 protein [Gemmatimonadaceae bacterium]|nr:lasso peptide biosynthesis B2 protein [Gemmatimonadaceae bacterium]